MADVLLEICERKRAHVAERKSRVAEESLLSAARQIGGTRGFADAIHRKTASGGTALIAEIKKASPSKGLIRADFDVAALAGAYEGGGAACLSVLTDEPYFQGHDDYVGAARKAAGLPVLRKDFIVDLYQVAESRAIGADCILLIMAAIEDGFAREAEAAAHALNLDVLAEVHDERELERALKLSTRLIGVNNRNLKNFEVGLEVAERLAHQIPADRIRVCESGIFTCADIARMKASGFHTFLVGEALMRQRDVERATRELLAR